MSKHLQSFDVFDTLLTRRVGVPRDLFRIVGLSLRRIGFIRGEATDFAKRRTQAETEARQQFSHQEIRFSEIYERLARELNWKPDEVQQAMQIELEVESRSLCAVPGMVETVQAARQSADQILFLTDMYLPADFIEKVLRREDFFRDGDRLLVSGELKRSKHEGQMFEEVKRLYPDVTEWRHTGDNPHADVEMARSHGVEATLDARCHLTRYERMARGSDQETSLWRSQLAAAMRLARLDNPETDDHRRAIWESGTNVVGPLLFGFVHWCLETARRRGLRRLYFVARDGQILHRVAAVITANWEYDVDCRYLYGSRQAWQPAAIDRFSKSDFPLIFVHAEPVSVQLVFDRLGLRPGDFRPQLERARLAAMDWKTPLDADARRRLKGCLLGSGIVSAIENMARVKRERLVAYLRQEGFWDGIPFGLVDIGWYGNLQMSLARVLRACGDAGAPTLTGLYLGLFRDLAERSGHVMADYWHDFASPKKAWPAQYLTLFELFTAADHGSVTGFERREDRATPILAEAKNERALNWGLAPLQASIVQFAELFSRNLEQGVFSPGDFFPIAFRLLDEFYGHPSRAEAAAWGGFPHSGGQTESRFEQLVPNWNRAQILAALLDRRRRPTSWWQEGSLATCPCLPLSLFLVLKRLKQRLLSLVSSDRPADPGG